MTTELIGELGEEEVTTLGEAEGARWTSEERIRGTKALGVWWILPRWASFCGEQKEVLSQAMQQTPELSKNTHPVQYCAGMFVSHSRALFFSPPLPSFFRSGGFLSAMKLCASRTLFLFKTFPSLCAVAALPIVLKPAWKRMKTKYSSLTGLYPKAKQAFVSPGKHTQ